MKTLIIGGGKIGYNLTKTLLERSYSVALIERSEEKCMKIAADMDVDILCGDGTSLDVLRDAGIEDADIVAAVTGTDEENLVICEIAKLCFNVSKTIARVNNTKNINIFKALGVDQTVSSTEVIANLIEYEVERDDYQIIKVFDRGSMVLAEITISAENNVWPGRKIQELSLPEECVIASVMRDDQVIYPRGDTTLFTDDRVMVLANHIAFLDLKRFIRSGGKHHVAKKN